ncbi:MAG: DUF1064 domain-containing protein [Flavobacteriales bacterium]
MSWGKKNKYNAVRQTYNGYSYDSKFEAQWAANLDMLKNAGEIIDWDRQYTVEMVAHDSSGNPKMSMKHKIDFRVHELDGTYTLLEAKGFETADYRIRKRWLEKLWLPEHSDYRYQVVKQGQGWRAMSA